MATVSRGRVENNYNEQLNEIPSRLMNGGDRTRC